MNGFHYQFPKWMRREVFKIFVGKYNSFYADDLGTMKQRP